MKRNPLYIGLLLGLLITNTGIAMARHTSNCPSAYNLTDEKEIAVDVGVASTAERWIAAVENELVPDPGKVKILCSSFDGVGYQAGNGPCKTYYRSYKYLHSLAGVENPTCMHGELPPELVKSTEQTIKKFLDENYSKIKCDGSFGEVPFLVSIVDASYEKLIYDMVKQYPNIDFTSYKDEDNENILEYIAYELEDIEGDDSAESYRNSLMCFKNIFEKKYLKSLPGPECKHI